MLSLETLSQSLKLGAPSTGGKADAQARRRTGVESSESRSWAGPDQSSPEALRLGLECAAFLWRLEGANTLFRVGRVRGYLVMSGESGQPEAGASQAGLYWQHPERNQAGDPGGVIRRAGSQRPKSWIQMVIEQITGSPKQCVTLTEVVPVTVLAVQRYLLEDEPRDTVPRLPLYCYDVTISDGVYQEKCYLDPSLNFLVFQNILKVGIEMRISRVSCLYNENRLGQGILCIDKVYCGETLDVVSVETPFRNRAQEEKPERPLRGGRSHYLALWNNEDPYGDIWKTNKQPEEFNFNSK